MEDILKTSIKNNTRHPLLKTGVHNYTKEEQPNPFLLFIFRTITLFGFFIILPQEAFSQTINEAMEQRKTFPIMKLSSVTAPEYCESSGGSTTFEKISSVNVVEKPGNLLDITVDVYIANPTNCKSGESCWAYDSSPEHVNVWIDWNGNKVWEPYEKVLNADLTGYKNINYGGTMTAKATVEIPPDAVKPTWLRANLGWGHDPEDPCETGWTYGNVIDQQVLWNIRVKKITATLNINIQDVPKPVWEGTYDEKGQLTNILSNSPVAAGMKNGWFRLPVELASFPSSLGDDSRTDCNWEIVNTGMKGVAGIVGKSGVISINLPQKIGVYELKLKFFFKNNLNNKIGEQIISFPLWVSYNSPQLSSIKKIWLQKAIEWADGSKTKEQIAEKIMDGIYSRSKWRYVNGGNAWFKLIEGLANWGNCRNMANVWTNLLLILGVDGAIQDGHTGRNKLGFVSPTGLVAFGNLESSNGNARGFIDQSFDRWVFASHWFGKLGNKYYDPVFNLIGSDKYYHVEYDIESIDGNTSKTKGGPTFYNLESNFEFSQGNWPKYRYQSLLKSETVSNLQSDEAKFTGSYSDTSFDSDGDGVYNQLGASIGVEITTPGMYRVTGILQKGDNFITSRSSYTDPAFWSEEFGPQTGNYEVNPIFSGEEIFNNALNGPYEMNLIIVDSAGTVTAADTFGTGSYSFSDFGEFTLRLNQVTEIARDTNSDSYYDEILVNFSTQTNRSILYTINISLFGDNQTLVSSSQTSAIPVGSNSFDFSLPAQNIAALGIDGPYTIYIQVIDPDGEQTAFKELLTTSYKANQFNPPEVKITGGSSSQGIDIDSNGLFDTLMVSLTVDALTPNFYTILAWLMGQNGENITWTESKTAFASGTNSAKLNFPGTEINKSQVDGPYKIGYAIIRDSAKVIFSGSDIYTTQSYTASQFEEPMAQIISSTGNYSENSIDVDSNKLIDTLVIEIEVVPRDSGNVFALARLVDSQDETILWSSTIEFLQENTPQKLHLKFDGRFIYGDLVDGPYKLMDLQIYHVGDPTQTIDIKDAYSTQVYKYSDFETAGVISGIISDSSGLPVQNAFVIISDVDNDYSDVNGKYNLVVLNDGEYTIKIKGPDTLNLNWSISLDGNFLSTGDSVKINVSNDQIVKLDFKAPITITEVDEKNSFNDIPTLFILKQNFPNPFNPSTTIEYQIPHETFVSIKVYDSIGREVATLVNNQQKAGVYKIHFNAENISSGIYFCRIAAENYTAVRKMLLLK